MIRFTGPAVRAASAAATLIGAMVIASPLFAASGEVLAQASSQQAMAAPDIWVGTRAEIADHVLSVTNA